MLSKLFGLNKFNKGIILLYHRIFNPVTDIWDLSVSPEHFEAHLRMLKKHFHTLSLDEMSELSIGKRFPRIPVCITFDDGYEDNFTVAKPLLEEMCIPATFFLSTGNIGTNQEFWWDELEAIFLQSYRLPASLPKNFELIENDSPLPIESFLEPELLKLHQTWKPFSTDPPTKRAEAFFVVWEKMRGMKQPRQNELLRNIREWAGTSESDLRKNRSMTLAQLKLLKSNPYIDVGAHTITHPALAMHDAIFQEQEIAGSKSWLETELGRGINWLAYPYGNYDSNTLDITRSLGFRGSVTTEKKIVNSKSNPFTFGRWVVPNCSSEQLDFTIKNIFKNTKQT
jgi:peptidoglycan/xylan/chitin deacetylase (PgdA/CDA1 family)